LKPKRMLWDYQDPLKEETPLCKGVRPTMLSLGGGSIDVHLIKNEALESRVWPDFQVCVQLVIDKPGGLNQCCI